PGFDWDLRRMGIENRDYYREAPKTRPTPAPALGTSARRPASPAHYRYLLYALVLVPAALFFLREPSVSAEAFRGAYWLAAIALVGHLLAAWLGFDPRRPVLVRAVQAAAFTGIAGMGLLLAVQYLSSTNGLGVLGRFIAFAYGLTDSNP